MSATEKVRRRENRRYALRLGLRATVIVCLTLFISRQYVGYSLAIAVATLSLYAASFFLRARNEQASDLLLILGDLPALIGVIHLPNHAPAFEALVPAWLIGTTVANLRKGRTLLLPFYSLAAWLVLMTHASSTANPLGYMLVQTLAVAVASAVALSVILERRTNRTDGLTGVLTRRAGLEELSHLSEREGELTLAFIDLRRFKHVNDQYGHAVGDEVLTIVAKRLRASQRQGDVVFRYGGDEFIAASAAPELETRLRNVFVEPVKTSSGLLTIESRIGIQHKKGLVDINAVVKEADNRMYAESRRDAQAVNVAV